MAKIHYPVFERNNGLHYPACGGAKDIIGSAQEAQQKFFLAEQNQCAKCVMVLHRNGFDLHRHCEAAQRDESEKNNKTIKPDFYWKDGCHA